MLVALLLLAAPDTFDKVFDPASDTSVRARKAAFDAAVKKHGVARAIRSFRGFEDGIDEAQEQVENVYARYVKAANAYWAYRKKTGAESEAVPVNLNKPALATELSWKHVATRKRWLRTTQDWAVERVAQYLKSAVSKRAMAALVAGLKDRNPHQRWRCARLLAPLDARTSLEARARVEKHPGVLAAIFQALGGGAGLNHLMWRARAGAIRALKDPAMKAARLKLEKGRLREDLGEKPGPTICYGIPSSSRRIVFCFDYPRFLGKHIVAAINTLPDDALFSVVICGGRVHRFKKQLVTGNRAAAIAFVKKTRTDGRSDLYAGLRAALDMNPDTIVLVTAAGPGGSPFTTQVMYVDPMQVGPDIMAYNRLKGVRIHAAGPSGARHGYWLENLTRQFGGTFKEG